MWLIFATLTVLLWGTSETIFKKVSTSERRSVLKLISFNGIILRDMCNNIYANY